MPNFPRNLRWKCLPSRWGLLRVGRSFSGHRPHRQVLLTVNRQVRIPVVEQSRVLLYIAGKELEHADLAKVVQVPLTCLHTSHKSHAWTRVVSTVC